MTRFPPEFLLTTRVLSKSSYRQPSDCFTSFRGYITVLYINHYWLSALSLHFASKFSVVSIFFRTQKRSQYGKSTWDQIGEGKFAEDQISHVFFYLRICQYSQGGWPTENRRSFCETFQVGSVFCWIACTTLQKYYWTRLRNVGRSYWKNSCIHSKSQWTSFSKE